ncbi:hypothetical protein ACO0LB_15925 [Undibacterium sp. SXout7W]|uniref:hypothetical protein n=1 Tax=Undibacterium sp. SXout7W TaxID=3413049 RepID=UPI003BF256B6
MFAYIVAIAWIYVVLLMALTEPSITAGVMTFLFYCVFPLTILLYLMRAPQRKRALKRNEAAPQHLSHISEFDDQTPSPDTPSNAADQSRSNAPSGQ